MENNIRNKFEIEKYIEFRLKNQNQLFNWIQK